MDILYSHVSRESRSKAFQAFRDGDHWKQVMVQYPDRVRYHAANLAAHNWDVIDAGDRLLVASAWSGGDWWDKQGNRIPLTDNEMDQFYPRIPRPDYDNDPREITRAWENATSQGCDATFRRGYKIVLDR